MSDLSLPTRLSDGGSLFYRRSALVLFLIAGAVAFLSFDDYGVSWDEYFRWKGGQEKLIYYQTLLSGGDAASVLPKEDNYPGLFDLTVAVLAEYTPMGLMVCGHLMSLLMGLGTVVGVWCIGRHLGGDKLAFWAALFILLTPRFYGHMFFNPKDIPFAAGMTWSLYFLLRWGRELPRPRLASTLALGVVLGLACAIRIGGAVVLLYVVLYAAYSLLECLKRERSLGNGLVQDAFRLMGHGALLGVVAYVVLIPWWPAIHTNPLSRPLETLQTVSQYPWSGHVLFAGERIPAQELPWHYPLTWLGLTLPDFLLLALGAGVVLLLINVTRLRTRLLGPETMPVVMVAWAALFPLAFVILRDSTLYDGIRHLLFILPPLACLAAFAWVHLLARLDSWKPHASLIAVGLFMLLTVYQLYVLYWMHPYEYVYFNEIGGGITEKQGRYEDEYWGTSMREASLWLVDYTGSEGDGPHAVFSHAPFWLYMPYLPENFHRVSQPSDADFFISPTRLGFHERVPGEVIHVVGRMGLPFSVVKDLRAGGRVVSSSPASGAEALPSITGAETETD